MKLSSCIFAAAAVLAAPAASAAGTIGSLRGHQDQEQRHLSHDSGDSGHPFYQCTAQSSGSQEVPPVSDGVGASILLSWRLDFSLVLYDLSISGGEAITQGHIHCGAAGSNGPVIATVLNPDIPIEGPGGVDYDGGQASYGSLSIDDIAETECGGIMVSNPASLFAAALAGNLYLNIHSEENPSGQTRGQLFECFRTG